MCQNDHFIDRAKDWDAKSHRVMNAESIAKAILNQFKLTGEEHLMDFGAGTGLLSWFLADKISKITAVDFSSAMLDQFICKSWPCEIDILQTGMEPDFNGLNVDGIISSMTLHHIENTSKLFKKFFDAIKPGGFLAIGDLVTEDGSFHTDNSGVFHFGFEEQKMVELMKISGFSEITFSIVHEMEKVFDEGIRKYPIFLLTGIRKL